MDESERRNAAISEKLRKDDTIARHVSRLLIKYFREIARERKREITINELSQSFIISARAILFHVESGWSFLFIG